MKLKTLGKKAFPFVVAAAATALAWKALDKYVLKGLNA